MRFQYRKKNPLLYLAYREQIHLLTPYPPSASQCPGNPSSKSRRMSAKPSGLNHHRVEGEAEIRDPRV